MIRRMMALAVLVAPIAMLAAASGCEQKVTRVEKTERVTESEPRMVSPGQEVIE